MKKKRVIRGAFDLDGVLAFYTHYDGPAIGPPNEEGLKLVKLAKDAGHEIIVQTCRTHPRWGMKAFEDTYIRLVAWLKLWKVPYDYIEVEGKALAHYYVDDRGVHFPANHGPAEEVFEQIQLRLMKAHENYNRPLPQRTMDKFVKKDE